MSEAKPTREERLAAKLRENLRRRKVQAREIGTSAESPDRPKLPTLPKPPPTR